MPDSEGRLHRIHPTTLQRARDLRMFSTPYERSLWNLLKNRQVNGLKFRRQHPFGPFIVDFYCAEARLVIDVDGDSHEDHRSYDEKRTAWLEDQGYRVIRFTNEQVNNDCDEVIYAIQKECSSTRNDETYPAHSAAALRG